ILEVAEGGFDRVGDRAGRVPAAVRLHDLPEHRVVHVPAGVVAYGGANVFWHAIEVADQIFGGFAAQVPMFLGGSIQVGHIRGVMLAVMDLHRLGIDMGFEGSKVVGKLFLCKGHSRSPFNSRNKSVYGDALSAVSFLLSASENSLG